MKKINRLPETAKSILGLPECWLYENGQFSYVKNAVRGKRLPQVEAEYKELLEEMGLKYTQKAEGSKEICEYWDPQNCEKKEMDLPVYELKAPKEFKYTHKFHKEIVMSEETIQRAKQLEKEVTARKPQFKERKERERAAAELKAYYDKVRALVKGKHAVVYQFTNLTEEMACKISDKEIKVLPLFRNNGQQTQYFAVFNLAEMEGRDGWDIVMEVPKGKESLTYGAGKWQVFSWKNANWARKLRIDKIQVIAA